MTVTPASVSLHAMQERLIRLAGLAAVVSLLGEIPEKIGSERFAIRALGRVLQDDVDHLLVLHEGIVDATKAPA